MKKTNRYAKAAAGKRRSGTRRARRQRQMICMLVCFVLCAAAGWFGYHSLAKTEKPQIVLPTPTPTVAVKNLDAAANQPALPFDLYIEKYIESLDESDIWMEDFIDTRTRREVVKGMYQTANMMEKQMDYILDLLDTTGLNAVIFDIKEDNGYITIRTQSELIKAKGKIDPRISDISKVINTLKEHNVYCIARISSFRDGVTYTKSPDFAVYMKDGSLFKDGEGHAWMNPFNKDVWEYLVEIGREAARLGFDEVNFDYCRFATSSKLKDADFGQELTAESKEAAITGFIRYACEQLKPMGVFVSADVFGVVLSSAIDASAVGQNYAEMSKYLDYICPMVYPSHYSGGYYNLKVPDAQPYELIYNAMLDSKKKLAPNKAKGRCAEVRPWMQAFTATWVKGHIEYGPEQLSAELKGTYEAGYNSWLLWNAAGSYSKFKDALEKPEDGP